MAKRAGSHRWLVPTVLLLVVLPVGAGLYGAVHGTRSAGVAPLSRNGSVALGKDSPPVVIGDEPTTYTITYRLERYGQPKVEVSTDRIEIRRPFDARIEWVAGTGAVPTRASRFGTLVIRTGQGPRSLVSPPAPATGDLRLKAALPDAIRNNYVEMRERRRVLGLPCQVYRAGSSVSAGDLVPIHTTADAYADFCVDDAGLLLEEVWVMNGKPLQRRIATARRTGVPLTDDRFTLADEQAIDVAAGNGFLRKIDPASGFEGTIYRLTQPPDGFVYRGRFLVAPPRFNPYQDPADSEVSPEQLSMVDVWVRGPDVLVFSLTIAADIAAVPQSSRTAQPLDLGPFEDAATVLDLRTNEVRLALPEDRFLRIAGTLPLDELVEVTRSLRAEEGTGPVFLDETGTPG